MKSVVVESSTVAKAIETAWLKAEKPEEFFIRVLQEHTSGFLGFGGQKAKIVFFFKNTNKSDSLFPVVLKQKEYTSFFGNFNLKVPTELNVVDNELNKNVSLGGQHKKKPHNNQSNQQKSKQSSQQPEARPRQHNNAQHGKTPTHSLANKAVQDQAVKQVKVQQHAAQQLSQDKVLANTAAVNKVLQASATPKMQVSLQAPVAKKTIEHKAPAHKESAVKDIATVLKKVQTQKIVSNVSRPVHKTIPKSATPKFETYADFINSTTGIPAEKESVVMQVPEITPKVETVVTPREELVVPVEHVTSVAPQATTGTIATPRTPLKLKRRPLTTENPGVSGITRSSHKATADAVLSTNESQQAKSVADIDSDDENKNDKE